MSSTILTASSSPDAQSFVLGPEGEGSRAADSGGGGGGEEMWFGSRGGGGARGSRGRGGRAYRMGQFDLVLSHSFKEPVLRGEPEGT